MLQRLILTFKPEGVEIRTLYRTKDGPNPGTKARTTEVASLVRTGLEQALETLDAGEVAVVGVSGFTTREDVLSIASASAVMSETRVKGIA